MDAEEEKRFRERMWEEMDNDDSYLHDFEEEGFSSRKQTYGFVMCLFFSLVVCLVS